MKKENILSEIRKGANALGYTANILLKDDGYPFDMCILSLSDDEVPDELKEFLIISLYPLGDDLEGSVFIQFYLQYAFSYDPENVTPLLETLSEVNRGLVLGHFNLLKEQDKVYFKYIHALPEQSDITQDNLYDILDMCIHAYAYNMEVIKEKCL